MTLLTAAPAPAPSIEYALTSPMLIVFGAAVLAVLIEAFVPRPARYRVQLVLSLGSVVAALAAVIALAASDASARTAIQGAVAIDGLTLATQATLLVAALPALALMAERRWGVQAAARAGRKAALVGTDAFTAQAATTPGSPGERESDRAGATQTEYFCLTLFALGGMMAFAAANDLLTLFVALEVLSLPLYLMCGLARHRRLLSQEAALKYFLLGAFSSAILLFGVALRYAATGSTRLDAAPLGDDRMLPLIGAALLLVGMLFKVGAVPFHSWVPDVYQGAPTPVTAFMAAATKIGAFAALLRITGVGLGDVVDAWRPAVAAIAIVTALVGAVVAVVQSDVKRMLAYSAIAHTGFLLMGVWADDGAGVSATSYYLVAYALSTIGAFAVVSVVRDERGEALDLERWSGLGRRNPVLAHAMGLFLLSFAGIPLTSGFTAKFAVFAAAAGSGGGYLVAVGVLASAIAAVFYIRVIVVMFFGDDPVNPPAEPAVGVLTWFAIVLGAGSVVALGVFPQPLFDAFANLSVVGW